VLRGAAVAGAVAVVLTAYPLWFQFKGPGSFTGAPWVSANYDANAKSYFVFSSLSLAGDAKSAAALAPNITEQSAYVGWPLLLLALVVVVWRTRESAIRATALTAVVLAVLSLGATPYFGTNALLHHHSGPWKYLASLPVFADALPVRLSLAVFPLLAYVLVTGLIRIAGHPRAAVTAVTAAFTAATAALIALFPLPRATQASPAAPAFYANGLWTQCVRPGRALIAFPFSFTAMRWSAMASDRFSLVGGHFFGPGDGTRAFGTPVPRATEALLTEVDATGNCSRPSSVRAV
jgi:hypothetical protein